MLITHNLPSLLGMLSAPDIADDLDVCAFICEHQESLCAHLGLFWPIVVNGSEGNDNPPLVDDGYGVDVVMPDRHDAHRSSALINRRTQRWGIQVEPHLLRMFNLRWSPEIYKVSP
jgi:hypothetical protein